MFLQQDCVRDLHMILQTFMCADIAKIDVSRIFSKSSMFEETHVDMRGLT